MIRQVSKGSVFSLEQRSMLTIT